MTRVRLIDYWRLGLHLLLGSRRFGVNNRWREAYRSWLVRPLFGFGWPVLLMPWRWPALIGIVRLRMEIAGLWAYPSRGVLQYAPTDSDKSNSPS